MKVAASNRPTRGQWIAIALGVLPWTWYLVRDLNGRMDIVALAWPVFGTLAVASLLVVALGLRSRSLALAGVSWAVCLVAVVVGPWRPLDTGSVRDGTAVRVAATNLYGDHSSAPGVARQIAAQHPDVLVVSEATDSSTAVLAKQFRYKARSVDGVDGDVAVFSNLPMRAERLPAVLGDQRGMRIEVDGPGGAFVLYALHLQKPGPEQTSVEVGFRTHRRLIDAVVEAVRSEPGPVMVAGDLNLVDRSSGYRDLTGVLDDAMRAGWVGPTSRKRSTRLLLARIDHVFMPSSWCSDAAETFDLRGSDHRGVVATVGRCG